MDNFGTAKGSFFFVSIGPVHAAYLAQGVRLDLFNKQDSIFTGCWVYRVVHVSFWKSKRRLVMANCLG